MHALQNGGNMPDQKLDNLLNLALDATEEEREKSRNLNVGYEKQARKWEIIVKYSEVGIANEEVSDGMKYGAGNDRDSVEILLGGNEISVVPLLGGYAIVTLPEGMLDEYSRRPQIEFIEKPTRLYFEDLFSKEASCITQVQRDEPGNLQLTFPVIRRRAMQQELNILTRKSMRRCPFPCERGGALFRLKMEAVMEPLCLEWQLAAILPVVQ